MHHRVQYEYHLTIMSERSPYAPRRHPQAFMASLWLRPRREEIAELEEQLRDQQARLASVVRLQRHAGLDDLTGLPACSVFQTALRREWDRARRDQVAVSLLELSIDNMRTYNEKHGQAAGDAVLKHVALELRTVAHRGGDMVARLLGTRFAAILPDTSEDGALAVARRFRASIETANTIRADDELVVRVGIATMRPDSASTWDELELEALAHRGLAAGHGEGPVSLSVATPLPAHCT